MPELRPYQAEAAERIREEIGDGDAPGKVRSTLLVMPTGSGKSVVIGNVVAGWKGRVLILAHRLELIEQLEGHIGASTGELIDRETAGQFSYCARVTVGSMLSVAQKRRLYRLGRKAFDLIVIDEGHRHGESYKRILEWFSDAKVLRVTATPDRADGQALPVDSVAYRLDILDCIREGWLVPVKAQRIHLDEIDVSHVKSSRGDLQIGALDKAMVEATAGIAKESCDIIGPDDGQGVAFFPGVESGMMAAEWLNKCRPGSARFVCGKTPPEDRKELFRAFKAGEFQFLVNVMIATEGFDHPPARWCIMGRPTKSRALYAQAAGRVTRPLKGLVDPWPTATERRDVIAESDKPDCTILDFYGNTGRHDLCTPLDVLGGTYTEAELQEAKKADYSDAPANVADVLQSARVRLVEVAKEHEARVKARREEVDAFFGQDKKAKLDRADHAPSGVLDLATPAQRAFLKVLGVDHIDDISREQAGKLIGKYKRTKGNGASQVQREMLERYIGDLPKHVPFALARNGINYLEHCRRYGHRVNTDRLRSLIGE